jgi:DNA-binding NtrC family response regulator
VARAVHAASTVHGGAFVSLNCGAIPAQLLESELFGHERGAFTGAVRSKPGLFEIARGGTIFLDEIGDMPFEMQVKLLRVLQQKEFRRVGGTRYLSTDARVVSASNRDLQTMVQHGDFREDLWYRLNVVEINVPPLRERREDLPALIDHFLERYGGERHGGAAPPKLSRAAFALLLDYDWPGNVRELENEIQRAIALAEGTIEPSGFSSKLAGEGRTHPSTPGGSASSGLPGSTLKEAVEAYERQTLIAILEAHGGRVASAAQQLGLTRAGLYKKINKYGLSVDKK